MPWRFEAVLGPLFLLLLALSNGIKLLLGHLSLLAMHYIEKHLQEEEGERGVVLAAQCSQQVESVMKVPWL